MILWIDRNAQGKVIGYYSQRQQHHGDTDFSDSESQELQEFTANQQQAETAERERQAWLLRAKEAVQENRQHIKYIEAFLSARFPAAFQPPTWGE